MEFEGRTAVITGGASGIGLAMAKRFAQAGANVVIGDIEEPPALDAVHELEAAGTAAMAVRTDVSDKVSMQALHDAAVERFGAVDVVCLNAGVGGGGLMGEVTTETWEWVLGVNLWGVIHGISVFLPAMEARNEGHLVLTASVAGLLSYPRMGPYNASKHAVATIGETLHHELAEKESGVGVTVLCPGLVNTNILDSERNRPEQLGLPALAEPEHDDETRKIVEAVYEMALDPGVVAELVHDAVVAGTFWLPTDQVFDEAVALRHRQLEARENPTLRGHIIEEELRSRG